MKLIKENLILSHIDLANDVLVDIRNKKRQSAAIKITQLVEEKANLLEKWGAITRLALSIGEVNLAIESAKNYLYLAVDDPKRIIQVAGVFAEAGRVQEAIELVESNSDILPEITKSHFLGTAYSQTGQFTEAHKHLALSIEKNPNIGISWLTLAAIHHFEKNDKILQKLEKMEPHFIGGNDIQNHIPYWFALGKALLDIDSKSVALEKFGIGNQLMANKTPFNRVAYTRYIDSIISTQNKQYFEKISPLKNSEESPVFIIGLPRSGTTLLQQVLSAHSEISNGGESNCFSLALAGIELLGDPMLVHKDINKINSLLTKASDEYLHLMSEKYGKSNLYVDKTLNLNHQIGIIKLCFPKAKVIKIHRNAKDNAWSCYRTFFNQGLLWSYKIDDIALFFEQESKLFIHWKNIFKEGIYELSYEKLVTDSEQTLKSLTEFLSITFEPSMLKFYMNKSIVQTASVGQIRSSFNGKSIGSTNDMPKVFDQFL
ncbi:MAG: tetratricopeptide (TPR) repeat protein [Flavobacteriales bacterium]|jgi:tetratricopeptide (TPR) repeat protein